MDRQTDDENTLLDTLGAIRNDDLDNLKALDKDEIIKYYEEKLNYITACVKTHTQ